jgi:hypothetical protein
MGLEVSKPGKESRKGVDKYFLTMALRLRSKSLFVVV